MRQRTRLIACGLLAAAAISAADGRSTALALHPAVAVPSGSSAAVTAAAGNSLQMASVGADGQPAPAGVTGMAISADGQSVVFATSSALRATASLMGQTSTSAGDPHSQIYVHDPATGATTLLSDPATSSTSPTVSADGRLVAYYIAASRAVVVVDRRATGHGALDGPNNLSLSQVSGSSSDLPMERVAACADAGPGPASSPCGPVLSADGDTIAYQASLDPVSPQLQVSVSVNGATSASLIDNTIDFTSSGDELGSGYSQSASAPTTADVTYTNQNSLAVSISGLQILASSGPAGAGAFSIGATTCTEVLVPQASCRAQLSFNPTRCPAETSGADSLVTAQLRTSAATPAGQSTILLSAVCVALQSPSLTLLSPDCPAVPPGLELISAPAMQLDNQDTPVEDTGSSEIGRPYVTWQVVNVPTEPPTLGGATFAFLPASASDCGLQLIDPSSAQLVDPLPASAPPPCHQVQRLTTTCTAYILVRPQAVALDEALLGVIDFPQEAHAPLGLSVLTPTAIMTERGIQSLIILRRDRSGAGQFAEAPNIIANIDSAGNIMPAASQPVLSADGRYVGFAAPVPIGSPDQQTVIGATQVWRHDTVAVSYLSGPTVQISCLPTKPDDPCAGPAAADSPAMSADGSQIAFVTRSVLPVNGYPLPPSSTGTASGPASQQVYLRVLGTAHTQLISATASSGSGGNGPSWGPAISADGSTMAFESAATNLSAPAADDGASNLFVLQVAPSVTAPQMITQASLPASDDLLAPCIDAHGRLVGFGSTAALVPGAPKGSAESPAVLTGYLVERHADLVTSPMQPHVYGVLLGLTAALSFDVMNDGPGPATVVALAPSGPLSIGKQTCLRTVLLANARCIVTVVITAVRTGLQTSSVLLDTADDGEPPQTTTIEILATVPVPQLVSSPDVADPGSVTQVAGYDFPPGKTVTLSWEPGIGAQQVLVGSAGMFQTSLLIFPNDLVGPRQLVASTPSVPVLAVEPFLVQAGSWQPLPATWTASMASNR